MLIPQRNIAIATLVAVILTATLLVLSKSRKVKRVAVSRVYKKSLKQRLLFTTDFIADDIRVFNDKIYLLDFKKHRIYGFGQNFEQIEYYDLDSITHNQAETIIDFSVDTTGLYISSAKSHLIFHINFKRQLLSFYRPCLFTRASRMQSGQFVFRQIDTLTKLDQVFSKWQWSEKQVEYLSNQYFKRSNDGGLSTDGFFVPGKNDECDYITYHLNYIIHLQHDSISASDYTIDGSQTGPEVIKISNSKSFTLAKMIDPVHRAGCFTAHGLLIVSSPEDESNTSMGDIYSLTDRRYEYSVSLPNYNGSRVTAVQGYRDGVVVIQGQNIIYHKL